MQIVLAALFGLIFGLGILISGMGNPAKVLNFFDLAGHWDPSLAFVMGGAVAVTAIGYRLVFQWGKPLLGECFALPTNPRIETSLLAGSALFGIGWGIAGFCPGGSIPMLGTGRPEPLIFVGGLVAGIIAARIAKARSAPRSAPAMLTRS
jgi:uncharacterized protein